MSAKKIHILGIDVQNDFCGNGNNGQFAGSLFVPGADIDAERIAAFINKYGKKIDDIHMTLDSHRVVQVFHPIFWSNDKGQNPNPFTVISVSDVENRVWKTTNPSWQKRGIEYVRALAAKGRSPLCVWPYHCIIGSIGHALVPSVSDALRNWERERFAMVDYCVKGDFFFSEHYGALEAEIPAPEEPLTMLNTRMVEALRECDELILLGEALSHCVKNTGEQIASAFGEENIKKFVFFSDCSSNVPGFENLGNDFVKNMLSKGMRVCKSTEYFA